MIVHNYIEDMVEFLLPSLLKEDSYKNVCTCNYCINDIRAIALNNIPPKYIATEKGCILSKANMSTVQSEIDVKKELIKAIEKVTQLPRHAVVE